MSERLAGNSEKRGQNETVKAGASSTARHRMAPQYDISVKHMAAAHCRHVASLSWQRHLVASGRTS